ncbi:MAG TPA: hypothetical protein VL492_02365 [Methylovirgula sp.]|jgi:hypothetical protein|nr:hypothetical protein [Methylovirgula sp.]
MASTFYDYRYDEAPRARSPDQPLPLVTKDTAAHIVTYRKFVMYARCAAFAVPFFMAFILYWSV